MMIFNLLSSLPSNNGYLSLADDSATPPPTDRIRQRAQKKTTWKVVLILWELTDWLLRRPRSASLNAFPFRSPRGPLQNCTAQWVVTQPSSFSYAYVCKQVCAKAYKNKKMSIARHLIASFVLWELTDSNRRPSACKADALNQLS